MTNGVSAKQTATTLLLLTRSMEQMADVDRRKKSQFSKFPVDSLKSMRLKKVKNAPGDPEIVVMALVIAERELRELERSPGLRQARKAVLEFVSALRTQVSTVKPQLGGQARYLAAEITRGLDSPPPWLAGYLNGKKTRPTAALYRQCLGLTEQDWSSAIKATNQFLNAQQTPAVDRLGPDDQPAEDIGVAERLTRLAVSVASPPREKPEYDTSDRAVKLTRVQAAGFRGSPEEIEVDLTKSGRPVCVLLWGDNGTGKSTVVDAIEFVTQARVDRSADFNSSLRPSVQNVGATSAEAAIHLSDGSRLHRILERNRVGRYAASTEPIRAGFRIAPVVIRRADILRFLDTETLSRGTVFFDYFPDPAGGIGYRPDEELRMLAEERFALRVTRTDLVHQLSSRYPGDTHNLESSDGLEKFVEDVVLAGTSGLADDERWANVDQSTRSTIRRLRGTQQRMKEIRKKLDAGVETLNPVAYRAQLNRIRPVLESIGADLTNSFLSITRVNYVKNIRTLVGQSGPVSLDIVVELEGGRSAFPQQIFSEGYKDLIAFLFFLSITKRAAERGQARVLVLDDVLQSVDATVRLDAMSHVLDEFKDWQLIVTGHDRGWHTQLRSLFNSKGVSVVDRVIGRWDFARGPVIHGSAGSTVSTLTDALNRGDDQAIAAASGVLLEQISHELSWRLGASVKRKKEDRYTLADLWSGVHAVLRKMTGTQSVVTELNTLIPLRNLVGAHYNPDAGSISSADVRRLGEASLGLYNLVFCETCDSWVEKQGPVIACRNGHKVIAA